MSRVALLHSPQASARSTTAIREALRAAGHEALMLAAGPNLAARLAELQPDAVFNNAPGLRRKSEQPHIVAALEMAGVPFTGSGLAAQIICSLWRRSSPSGRAITAGSTFAWTRPGGRSSSRSMPSPG